MGNCDLEIFVSLTGVTINGFCKSVQWPGRRSVQAPDVTGAALRASVGGVMLALALAACAPAYLQQRTDEPQSAADVVRSADLTPRFPKPVRQASDGERK